MKKAKVSKDHQASHSGHYSPKLSPNEAQVLSYFLNDFLTTAQIAVRRKTTKRAVQLIRQRLIRKGFMNRLDGCEASQGGGVAKPAKLLTRKLRLHAMQWKVGILHVPSWEKTSKRVIHDFMGCFVSICEGFVEIYAKESVFFEGDTENECMLLALRFFERLGYRLENDLRVKLIKPRSENWELVKGEWATEGSEVAVRHIGDGVPLKVYAADDGHLWFWGDWSKKVPEHETADKVDSEEVNKHLNDWRSFHPPTNSQLLGLLNRIVLLQEEQALVNKETAAGLSVAVRLLVPKEESSPVVLQGRPWYVG